MHLQEDVNSWTKVYNLMSNLSQGSTIWQPMLSMLQNPPSLAMRRQYLHHVTTQTGSHCLFSNTNSSCVGSRCVDIISHKSHCVLSLLFWVSYVHDSKSTSARTLQIDSHKRVRTFHQEDEVHWRVWLRHITYTILCEFSHAKWNAPIIGAFHFAWENSHRIHFISERVIENDTRVLGDTELDSIDETSKQIPAVVDYFWLGSSKFMSRRCALLSSTN